MAPLGLRPRHLVTLTVLRDHGGSTQQALAGTLRIDRTNLVGLLNELEAQDLIARRRSEEDRRRHIVEVTEAGLARLAEAEDALGAAEDEVLAGLDAEQRRTLADLLARATREESADCVSEAVDPCVAPGAGTDDCVESGGAAADDCVEAGGAGGDDCVEPGGAGGPTGSDHVVEECVEAGTSPQPGTPARG
ncbi:MarR family winged helix-turn-helix transcriptional regulator [Patulibacter minatonensis]|uniref:MarR family winged helix-turn-helix transcriptional regulator n=1 Tax=Patulibacter minatonensis TaxID=298163 RepID=UPI001FE19959|nr:MarR family winged helix-turn-helix transcriptional regulator [Patulibacter minatonensis]